MRRLLAAAGYSFVAMVVTVRWAVQGWRALFQTTREAREARAATREHQEPPMHQ